MKRLVLGVILVAGLLSSIGCAGTSSNVRSDNRVAQADTFRYEMDNYGGMTPEARSIFDARLRSRLGTRLADASDKTLKVRVTYYRMRHGAARALVGIMAGQDRITSEASIVDASGAILGSLSVDSKNPTALFTSRGLIEAHADEIADYILGGKTATTAVTPSVSNGSAPAPPASDSTCEACKTIKVP